MSGHALEVLEFPRVLERIARRASSRSGRERVVALRPGSDSHAIALELARVGAVMRFVGEQSSWGMPPIPDVADPLHRLSVEGALLDAAEIYHFGVLLSSSHRLSQELGDGEEGRYPELATIRDLLLVERDLEKSIERCVDAEGQVLDSASKELKQIRGRLRGAHSRIVRKLEAFASTLPDRFLVPDASITIREGRYVIPIRREGKREVGIVHDESQTGATVFVEPPAAIELMNQVRDMEGEHAREIRRVLGELTASLESKREGLVGALQALADFDGLHARATVALEWRAVIPDLVDSAEDEWHIRDGRHPLLVETAEEAVVPFDLDLSADDRAIVVSGPNTGGKSVFLKATGLISALTQSGIVPPVGKGTRLPVFESFFADIGDEQSIARNLSTFSAHVANLSEIVGSADRFSLVLIDEMGTGTDPAEGAALSRAVLEALVERGARTIVSSHLGELKRLDVEGSGIVNASLEFDAERMEPTYRVVKGRPGRSYGLAIARRLGFPPGVLDRAETYRDDDEARMEEVLARLERREREAERLVHELDLERAQTSRLRGELETREKVLRDAESTAGARARESARRLLLEARAEVEEAVLEVRRAAGESEGFDEAVRSARRRVEEAAARQQRAQGKAQRRRPSSGARAGDRVRIGTTGAKGYVVDLRTNRALVEVGGVKLEVPLEEVEVLDPLPDELQGSSAGGKGWSGPPRGEAKLEIDLRGMRVHEVEIELSRAVDQAILEDMSELRIIHGKGTGALRERVGEMLDSDRRVGSVRMGGPTEGGAGVTVAKFGETS